MENESRIVNVIGPMPPFYEVAYALWGKGIDFDSDGDSADPESTTWRELTVILRPNYEERVDIDPLQDDANKLKIQATSSDLLDRTCNYLHSVGAIKIEG